MSEPTFRIRTEHSPGAGARVRWAAYVYLVADDEQPIWDTLGSTEADVMADVRTFVRSYNTPPDAGGVYLADEHGEPWSEGPAWP
jgi:hypothetical protein